MNKGHTTMEFLLYGLEKNETRDYMETLLFVHTDREQVERVQKVAERDGWHSFRIARFTMGTLPNFAQSINL
jgi:ribosomal protein S2